jgi:hypothetical protein
VCDCPRAYRQVAGWGDRPSLAPDQVIVVALLRPTNWDDGPSRIPRIFREL